MLLTGSKYLGKLSDHNFGAHQRLSPHTRYTKRNTLILNPACKSIEELSAIKGRGGSHSRRRRELGDFRVSRIVLGGSIVQLCHSRPARVWG